MSKSNSTVGQNYRTTVEDKFAPRTPQAAWNSRCEDSWPAVFNDGDDNPLACRIPSWNQQKFNASYESGLFAFSSLPSFVTLTRHVGEKHGRFNYLTQMAVAVRQQVRESDPYIQIWKYLAGENVEGTSISFTLEEAAELAHTLLAAIDLAVADLNRADGAAE